jgi:hypothetical protein
VRADRDKTPNLVLRHIREVERHETREEFAAAVVTAGHRIGVKHLGCDARLVGRWEDGDVECPRPAYQRALNALTGRSATELGFRQRNAIRLPSSTDLTPDRLSFEVDAEGRVWATVDRRRFLVGTAAAVLAQAGLPSITNPATDTPTLSIPDPYSFSSFVRERWPTVHLSRPHPDFGVDYTAVLPANRSVEGAIVQLQLQESHITDGRAVGSVRNLLRWEEFSRCASRGLIIAACPLPERPRFFAIDSREARRRAGHHEPPSVAVPDAYELDDLSFGLLWACASLDAGLLADDQELSLTLDELAPYENLPSSAVSREAAANLGMTSQMWLGSDFCARHILRNLERLPAVPVFWTREQTGSEACPWLLFTHKHAYLRATSSRYADDSLSRMFCIPGNVVAESPVFERILLLLTAALIEATGIRVTICDDPAYSEVEGFVLGGQSQAIIANWVRGEGIWHVDTAGRASVLSDFREASGYASAHSVIDAKSPRERLRALAGYLDLDWAWIQRRCHDLAQVGTAGLLRPRSRHISTVGVDTACSYIAQPELDAA